MQTWMIGNTSVTRIEEQVGPNDMPAARVLPDLVPRTAAAAFALAGTGPLRSGEGQADHQQPFLADPDRSPHYPARQLRGATTRTGPGCARFHNLNVPFLERLRAAGAAPEDIDIVLCTHLHADHVGWNTGSRTGAGFRPFRARAICFPRSISSILIPQSAIAAPNTPGRAEMYDDSVLPVIESGQSVLLDGEHAIDDRLFVQPAPGHTPGHVFVLSSGGWREAGAILRRRLPSSAPGARAGLDTRFCEIPEQARATRRKTLEHCAEHGALLFPTALRRTACRAQLPARQTALPRSSRRRCGSNASFSRRAAAARWYARWHAAHRPAGQAPTVP
jgi:glyoxylase-like metal-dependent hydrolase (beta-lactamase superfamily II)